MTNAMQRALAVIMSFQQTMGMEKNLGMMADASRLHPLPAPISAWVMAGDMGVDSSCQEGIEVLQGWGGVRLGRGASA